jgi:prephenate dehydratase
MSEASDIGRAPFERSRRGAVKESHDSLDHGDIRASGAA